jgi:hypothetical protein
MRQRMFTNEQEKELATQIRSQSLCKGYIFTDVDFRPLFIDAYYRWNAIGLESEVPDYKQFMASNGVIHFFKKRHCFSSRRSHFKRRSLPNPELDNKFVDGTRSLVNSENPE